MFLSNTHVQTGIRAIDASADHFAVPDEDTAHRRLVTLQGELGHFNGLAHESFMILAVGDWSEDHFVGG